MYIYIYIYLFTITYIYIYIDIYIELYMDMELHIWLVCNHAYERTNCDWHFTFHADGRRRGPRNASRRLGACAVVS